MPPFKITVGLLNRKILSNQLYTAGPYAGFSEGVRNGKESYSKSIIFASASIITAWGLGGGAEAERYCRLCLVHSRSSLDLNSDFH